MLTPPSPPRRAWIADTVSAGTCGSFSAKCDERFVAWRTMTALANAFGDGKLVPLAVGKRIRF